MSTIKSFEELTVWKKSRMLCEEIFALINRPDFSRDFKLRDQINGSSGSIMDNIAEGFGRGGSVEFINFLCIARGSAFETKSQLYRALDRKYFDQNEFEKLASLVDEIIRMITNLSYTSKIAMTKVQDLRQNNRQLST